jgi:addiction module HigA family antidote
MRKMSKSLTTTENERFYPIITPGEILKDEFVEPLGLTIHGLARELDVPATRIQAIVNDGRQITADTALRLSRFFGNSPQFWMNLQANYELEKATRVKGAVINERVHRRRTG